MPWDLSTTRTRVLIGAAALLVTGVIAAVALISLDDNDDGSATPSPTATASPTPSINVRTLNVDWASDNADTLQRLVGSSTHVFIGEVLELTGIRLENLSGRGDPIEVPVSIFDVSVETQFKGSFNDALAVVEQLGGIIEEDGEDLLVVLDADEPLQPGTTYLFFSIEKDNGTLNTPPFGRFVVQPDGTVQPLDDWKDLSLSQQLQALSADKLHDLIVTAVEGVIR